MDFLQALLPKFSHIGIAGYWAVFAFAYFESVVVLGSLIPGATVVVLAGVLAAQGYLDPGDLLWFAAAGAFLGDLTSYYLGTKGVRWFRAENRFLKLDHLEQGRRFMKRHGGKSVLLGRFFAPLRSMIPFIAGLAAMDIRRFLAWNLASAAAWSVLHIYLGYFAGNAIHTFRLLERWSIVLGVTAVLIGFAVSWLRFYRSGKGRP